MKLRTLIIEDEPLAQKGLAEYIAEFNFLELAGVAEDAVEALEILSVEEIDLIFLDIQMSKISGIDFLKTVKNPPMVIICSAFAEYALESYELSVIDYLLKPVRFNRFTQAVIKARDHFELLNSSERAVTTNSEYVFVKYNNLIEKISFDSLIYVEGKGNYIFLQTSEKKMMVYLTLKAIEEILPENRFIRIHKSYIISISHLQSIDSNQVSVSGIKLPLSRKYREDLLARINHDLLKR